MIAQNHCVFKVEQSFRFSHRLYSTILDVKRDSILDAENLSALKVISEIFIPHVGTMQLSLYF